MYYEFKRELVNLWPRPDARLISGQPVVDLDRVHGLIADLRTPETQAAPEDSTIGDVHRDLRTVQADAESVTATEAA